ncbi:high-affinity nickel-transport protein-domain-containing protein [Mycena rosella]|uniref:Nickel/cobalt efflux system n=1 Tax=Mycena rosella TaxID=1033263 RepID=A0AAD7DMX9_MYCRO|nr:high-affinity nickel-transport protein-domain-containing protein [Mycena rosella]
MNRKTKFPRVVYSRRTDHAPYAVRSLPPAHIILDSCQCRILDCGRHSVSRKSDSIFSLALLAWTLGLRHALDADHISAIDNATRGLINLGQLPVTCGLFFSLGHSTIVIVVNIAIAISSSIYNKLDSVGTVGGIVGAAVSGSFLFIVGLANSIILWRILRQRQKAKQRREQGAPHVDEVDSKHNHMLMMRILGPVVSFVNKPWKMYPVGLLFGFGFDTASSIALLAVSALARKRSDGSSIPSGDIVILPLLFTAGMTLIDSADSILMLYSYSGFPERTWAILDRKHGDDKPERFPAPVEKPSVQDPSFTGNDPERTLPLADASSSAGTERPVHPRADDQLTRDLQVKLNVMSGLSIVLTLMSILVAFSISLITIMGLIGEQCAQCKQAASAADGGGLAGSWWRGWAKANDNSGYIGAAIVGAFVGVVACWYASRRLLFARQTTPVM